MWPFYPLLFVAAAPLRQLVFKCYCCCTAAAAAAAASAAAIAAAADPGQDKSL